MIEISKIPPIPLSDYSPVAVSLKEIDSKVSDLKIFINSNNDTTLSLAPKQVTVKDELSISAFELPSLNDLSLFPQIVSHDYEDVYSSAENYVSVLEELADLGNLYDIICEENKTTDKQKEKKTFIKIKQEAILSNILDHTYYNQEVYLIAAGSVNGDAMKLLVSSKIKPPHPDKVYKEACEKKNKEALMALIEKIKPTNSADVLTCILTNKLLDVATNLVAKKPSLFTDSDIPYQIAIECDNAEFFALLKQNYKPPKKINELRFEADIKGNAGICELLKDEARNVRSVALAS